MKVNGKRVLVCSCENTMSIDPRRLGDGLKAVEPVLHRQLCLAEVEAFRAALDGGEPLLVCCTQEAPLFAEIAAEAGQGVPAFVNIREHAGWSDEGARAIPKMAALIAEAALDLEPTPSVTLRSDGVAIVYACDDVGLDVARRLAADRAVSCLLVPPADHLAPPTVRRFALFRGRVAAAKGHLGAFDLTVADLSAPAASSRGVLRFSVTVPTTSLCGDVLLDLSNGPALFPEGGRRDGYVRADSRVLADVERALAEVRSLVGEFDKPRYVRVEPDKCAHSRNGKIGCTRCLDACPTSSIRPKGDGVEVDVHSCSGHGACSAVCPTGAITYAMPAANGLFQRLRTLLGTYRKAGGEAPQLLIHDLHHGADVVDGLARFDRGLPADVIPFAINEVTAIGLDFILSALVFGARRLFILVSREQESALTALTASADLAERIIVGLGYAAERVTLLSDVDPALVAEGVRRPPPGGADLAADYLVLGGRRETLGLALSHLHARAPAPVDALALPAGAPFGRVVLDEARCTLCHSCVTVCPTQALGANPDRPMLTFLEGACVQCGLCRVTCPENAIAFEPRVVFAAAWRERTVLKEEDPFTCIRCGTPFGIRSSIETIVARLAGHAMFAEPGRLDLLKMCENCRVIAQLEQDGGAPMAGSPRPKPRTAEDYLRERKDRPEGGSS
jgi:ferredoxin